MLRARVLDTQKPAPPVANQKEELPELVMMRRGEAVEVLPRYQGSPGSCRASSRDKESTLTKLSSSK